MKITKSHVGRTVKDLHQMKRAIGVIILVYLLALSSAVTPSNGGSTFGDVEGGSPIVDPLDVVNTDFQSTLASNSITVPIAADSDDDWWGWDGSEWVHWASNAYVYVHKGTGIEYTGQFRFTLDIPKGSLINSAYFNAYEDNDRNVGISTIQRIDETNVGPLEADDSMPNVAASPVNYYHWDNVESEIGTAEITELVQVQVDLDNWQSGYHIGIRFRFPSDSGSGMHRWNDYQSTDPINPVAFLEITYTEPSPQPATWLDGWPYRKSHEILQTPLAGTEYPVPIDVYLGSGTDTENTVFLDQNARPGLDDVRFTDENNQPLEYWREDYYKDPIGEDYFADDGAVFGWYYYCYPNAIHYNDRTYVTYQGDGFYAYITYYDHENKTWSPRYYVGESQLSNDDHGAPAMWIDNEGYIHVVYGAHNDPLMHARSTLPERIERFEMLPNLDTGASTYPNVAYDSENNIVHLWYRKFPGASICDLEYISSSDNGQTWSNPKTLVTVSPGHFIYKCVGGLDNLDPNRIHFSWALYNSSDPYGQVYVNVYYGYLDLSTGLVYNAAGISQGQTVTEDEWPNMLALNTGGCHVTGPNMKIPNDSSNPYLVFNVVSRAGTGARTSTMVYWTGTEWSGMNNISTTTTNGASDIIIYSPSNISAFVTSGRDITHWNWDGSEWSFVEYCYKSSDSDGNYLTYATVPVGTKWTGTHDPEIQIVFTEHIPSGGKHTKGYAWGVNGIVQKHEITGARFWVKCPGNLSEENQEIYIYYGRASAISSSKNLEVSTNPSPLHGSWGPKEFLPIIDTSSYSITHFSETSPNDMLVYPDSDIAGSGFAESFAVVSDWTSTGTPPTTNGDVSTLTVPGDSSYDYFTSNSASLSPGYYYVELRYRASVAATSYFRLRGYEENNAGGVSTLIMDTTYTSTSWRTYRTGFQISHEIESVSFSCIATSSNTDFQFDYLRISKETGWQHDGSTISGVSASGGGSISTDGEYISLTSDSDGSIFDITVDTTSTTTPISVDDFPFLSVKFHPNDVNDIYTLQTYDGSSYGTLVSSQNSVDGRYYVRDLDTTIMFFRFVVGSSQTIRIDYLKMYSIANFSVTYSGGHKDAFLYVDSSGALVSSEDFVNWIELEYEPAMSMNTEEYQWARIEQSEFSHFNLDVAYHLDTWSHWDEELLYHLYAGTMSGFKFRLSNAGRIQSIKFGTIHRGMGNAPTNVQVPHLENPDDSTHIYSQYREYQFTTKTTDVDGFDNIERIDLTLLSADRSTEYWTVRYIQDSNVFREQKDPNDYVMLNTAACVNTSAGSDITITFYLTFNWNHPAMDGVTLKSVVFDDDLYSDTDYYDVNWIVESRLELSNALTLSDGIETLNRGDPNGELLASGSLRYYDSAVHPHSDAIDIYIENPDASPMLWYVGDYSPSSGFFSCTMMAGPFVGLYTYTVHVVPKGAGYEASTIMFGTASGSYIVDSIKSAILVDQEASTDDTLVFNLFLTYAYDNQPVLDYTVMISKNGLDWQLISSSVISDEYNETIENTYIITSVVERIHGLTTLYEPAYFMVSGDVFTSGTVSSLKPSDFNDFLRYARELAGDLGTLFLEMYGLAGNIVLELVYQLTTLTDVLGIGLLLSLIIASIVVPSVGRQHLLRRKAHQKDGKKKKNNKGPISYEPKRLTPP